MIVGLIQSIVCMYMPIFATVYRLKTPKHIIAYSQQAATHN